MLTIKEIIAREVKKNNCKRVHSTVTEGGLHMEHRRAGPRDWGEYMREDRSPGVNGEKQVSKNNCGKASP